MYGRRTGLLLVGVWASLLAVCWAQRAGQLAQDPCASKMTCSECTRTPSCAWCFASEFNAPRCFNPAIEGGTARCNEESIFNPDNKLSIDPLFNKELSRAKRRGISGRNEGGADGDLVQMKPQKVKLQTRMNQMQKLTFAYSRANDYPIDLYYLMDLSASMRDDKEKLSALGSRLSATMRNLTSDFRIGFGSFVDKLALPYVSTVPEHLISPCTGCTAPYGYRNHMSLSKDTAFFETAVAKAGVSGNQDSPEGGFDAIMQAVVCKKQVGWRDQARRLLVFSTDAGFHYAGDGKLGGIVQPNDGECHMENNLYTHSTLQDYPSISHINFKVKQHAINMIFAVTSDQKSLYEELSKHIEGSSSGTLSKDSNNLVDLVREEYNKISSAVEMKDTSSEAVQIVYYSSCLGGKGLVQTKKCDGLKVGDLVEFTAEITVKECPKDRKKWKQTFTISPVGISESLTVELETICECPCEQPGHPAYNDSPLVCNGGGVSACGVCACRPGRVGRECECAARVGASAGLEHACRASNASTGPLCSGRGSCTCGVCQCDKTDDPLKVISGPFCECDNFSCDRNKGQLCSGRGDCSCGTCSCQPKYSGPACQCHEDQEACKSPVDNTTCSGKGKCVCDQCVCDVVEGRHYSGKYCEQCLTCPGRCGEFKDCVLCEVHKRGPMFNVTDGSCGTCALLPVIEEGKVEANESRNEHLCNFYDEEDCLFVYIYSTDEDQRLVIRAQKDQVCPKKMPILAIVLGVVAAIVLAGLALLLLWKMATTIHDRREFARFENERMMAKCDTGENPIYIQPSSTFNNPTYAGK